MPKGVDTYLKGAVLLYPSAVKTEKRVDFGRYFLALIALVIAVYTVISPKTAIGEVTVAAVGFARNVLPVMFPFAVATGLLIRSGAGEICGRILEKPFRRAFGLSGAIAAPFLIGMIAGFPIGAKAVCDTYGRGTCGKGEAERALALCANPGFGFTVAGVGYAMWGDLRFGALLWVSCVLSSVAVGVVGNAIDAVNRKEKGEDGREARRENSYSEGSAYDGGERSFSLLLTVTETVAESALTMLRVMAFVVFFKLISGIITGFTALLPFFSLGDGGLVSAAITAFFEFSSGVSEIAAAGLSSAADGNIWGFGGGTLSRLLTASALAWSGVSVHMQTAGFTAPSGISMREYYRGKAASAFLAPLFLMALCALATLLGI